ncbi:Uncharacterized conserved protein, contains Mth938-like domain [Pseudooceanicola antarcticus]|uniref:Uncharacterized conserved protein, contains Mth938-like domain n=1 Tax=Pseudooceanicola antarcticus TaxID=1247613 RepID=A0A285J7H5_9RHOB|nr:Mth938-like domain-containing protein [Pseudooceanicola antarcticus]PJE27054.1 hypothetical protein CVM39_17175 [Pseudooceanicola antarcticus]SNY56290.1 Uncharacterized conserved protein, contains Mth938-like domain [Pseudooceanicola antarcticus]
MELVEISYDHARPIDGYGPGFIRIGAEAVPAPVLVLANSTRPWGGETDTDPLLTLAGDVDVILLGTGAEMRPVPTALREALEEAGIGIEPMATPTACRSFNVLLSEGRRIAAALLPV